MFCPNCGKELKDGSKFCGYCGAQIRENTTPVGVQQPTTVNLNEFKMLKDCFTNPYSDESLSLVVSIVVFAAMFLINWITFLNVVAGGIGVTAVVIAGMYLLEYLDKGQEWDGKKATGRIAFRLVLPSVAMLVSGLFIRLFANQVMAYFDAGSMFSFSGSNSGDPNVGLLIIGLLLMLISITAFIMIETHALHKKSTGFVYVSILIITAIIVGSVLIVAKGAESSISGGLSSMISDFM